MRKYMHVKDDFLWAYQSFKIHKHIKIEEMSGYFRAFLLNIRTTSAHIVNGQNIDMQAIPPPECLLIHE